jgi:hypothetical protein
VRRSVSQAGHTINKEIAVVVHFKAKPVEEGQKASRSQSGRAHQGSALRRSDIDRGAKYRNSFG